MRAELGQDGAQAALYHNAMTQLPNVGHVGMLSQQSGASVELFLSRKDSAKTVAHQHSSARVAECMHTLFTRVVIVRSLAVRSYERCPPA